MLRFIKKLSFLYQTLLNLHLKNTSLIIVGFLFSFKLKIIPNYRSRFPLGFWSGSKAMRYVLSHFQNQSVPILLRYENHAQKNLFQWKQNAYIVRKLEQSDSNPVWWKHSSNVGTNEMTYKEKTLNKTLSMFTVSERNFRRAFQKSSKHCISHVRQ